MSSGLHNILFTPFTYLTYKHVPTQSIMFNHVFNPYSSKTAKYLPYGSNDNLSSKPNYLVLIVNSYVAK